MLILSTFKIGILYVTIGISKLFDTKIRFYQNLRQVPLMRGNCGPKKTVPLKKRSFYRSTYANKLIKVCLGKYRGPGKMVPLYESSTSPGFHL